MSNDDSEKQTAETEEPNAEAASSTGDDGEATPDDGNAETHASDAEGSERAPEAEDAEPSLEEQLEKSKAATGHMKEKMLRVAADFENYRRRAAREVEEARRGGTQGAIKDLLPVFDNLERATAHVDDKTDVESLVKGLDMVHKQFIDVIGKMGIERIDAVGQGFDPNVHESIQYEHSEEHEAGVVMTELQSGYRMGTMLLRPSLVVVSRGPAPDPAPEAAPETEPTTTDADDDDADEEAQEADASEGEAEA